MTLTRLPGLIDVHVHLREPGATYKEDFETGSRAAVKGGFTYILDMPNNPIPTVTPKRLWEKIALADAKAVCTIGFHYGTTGGNLETFESVWDHPRVFGLKIYCNHTTGELLVEDPVVLEKIFRAWESPKPILVHAEGERLYRAIELAQTYG
ncbi:MAG: amidohydrolase family protein, partial [Patescibacteria group bacterium]